LTLGSSSNVAYDVGREEKEQIPGGQMGEKRKYMRFNVVMDAVCRTGGMMKKLRVKDFCREGLGIQSTDPIAAGEPVEVEVMIPGDNVPVMFQGEVSWAADPGPSEGGHKGGIKIKNITNHDRSRILEYIYEKWIMPERAGAN